MKKDNRSFLSRAYRFGGVLFLTGFLSITYIGGASALPAQDNIANQLAQQAHDDRVEAMERTESKLINILWEVVLINRQIPELFTMLKEELSLTTQVIIGSFWDLALHRNRSTQAIIDANTLNAQMAASLENAQEHTVPKHELLCKNVMLGQAPLTIQEFESSVSKFVQGALDNMGRGPEDDPNSSQYSLNVELGRCMYGFGSTQDGYEDASIYNHSTSARVNCSPSMRAVAGRLMVDSDLSPLVMDGSMALEVPRMNREIDATTSVEYLVPDPQNDEQWMWLSGFYYCYQMQGSRPNALRGANMDTPAGVRERAAFYHGLSQQSEMNKKCSDLLAYYTRPNGETSPTDMATGGLVAQQNTECEAARGILSQAELQSKFGGCNQGLSRYQAEYLQHRLCKTNRYYVAKASAGTPQREMTDDALLCTAKWNMWKASVALRHAGLIDAVMGQQKVRDGWPAQGLVEAPQSGGNLRYAKSKKVEENSPVHKVKAPSTTAPNYPIVIEQ